ncbi:hypothetical protein J2W51_003912 [Tardiphaga robiniae]|uniref:hypothetical protein n=1 Tax=Tardiphaga robiniae TaxID=943830 RepID=UPI00285AA1B6|nr:hypothetical protein [Tardiphaga robiniae]MDR6661326.1 hypothetical protein [Tardiphaga robiniae]
MIEEPTKAPATRLTIAAIAPLTIVRKGTKADAVPLMKETNTPEITETTPASRSPATHVITISKTNGYTPRSSF